MKKEDQIFYTIGGSEQGSERWEQDEPEQILHIDHAFRKREQKSCRGQKVQRLKEVPEEERNIYGLDMYLPHGKREYGGGIPLKKRQVIRIRPEIKELPSRQTAQSPINDSEIIRMGRGQKGRKELSGGGTRAGNRQTDQEKKGKGRKGGNFVKSFFLGIVFILAVFCAGVGTGWYLRGREGGALVNLAQIQPPSWIRQDLIRKNVYSRPAVSLRQVNDIVIHYVANPGSSAEQNRNYFDGLADQGEEGASASAHFVIGLEGEIIQCIPVNEIAYASNNRNGDTVAIECCHPDETGKFTDATYESLVKLTAWLCDETGAGRKNIIRHYDVTEKICPKYFVDHEDAWKEFKKAVKAYKGEWEK